MSEDRIITVTIDGKAKGFKVDLEGFHGVGCKAVAEAFDSMGTTVQSVEKDEMYEQHNQNVLRQSQ